jgi:hypothetical protein
LQYGTVCLTIWFPLILYFRKTLDSEFDPVLLHRPKRNYLHSYRCVDKGRVQLLIFFQRGPAGRMGHTGCTALVNNIKSLDYTTYDKLVMVCCRELYASHHILHAPLSPLRFIHFHKLYITIDLLKYIQIKVINMIEQTTISTSTTNRKQITN